MASVVINTRFNNRKAEADLKELQAKAKETAREINAVEKGLGSATTKRNKLRDDLEAARQKAAETAAALDEVNARTGCRTQIEVRRHIQGQRNAERQAGRKVAAAGYRCAGCRRGYTHRMPLCRHCSNGTPN